MTLSVRRRRGRKRPGRILTPMPLAMRPSQRAQAAAAHVLVNKYANHLPLYQEAQIYSRQGVDYDRFMFVDWKGRAAFELRPVQDAPMADLKRSTMFFINEARPSPRSGGTKDEDWILLGARPRRPTLGRHLSFKRRLRLCPAWGGQHAERMLLEANCRILNSLVKVT